MNNIPSPDVLFPNAYHTSCFLKNAISAPNIFVGDYTYYDDPVDPTAFERNNVLFNWPEFGDRLIIGKFCALASGVQFIMGSANHRLGQHQHLPFQRFWGCVGGQHPAPPLPAPLQRGHRSWKRRVDWAGERGHARRPHRRWRDCGRLLRCDPRCARLYAGRRQPSSGDPQTL